MTKTNNCPGTCKRCGGLVPAEKGILTSEWNNYEDDTEWVIRHADESICNAIIQAEKEEQSHNDAIERGIQHIMSHGEKSAVMDGDKVIYDGRRGYNSVGWLLTRTGDTLYMTSRSNLDGHDMSETYIIKGAHKFDDVLWMMELL